jgi:hypothetical protein
MPLESMLNHTHAAQPWLYLSLSICPTLSLSLSHTSLVPYISPSSHTPFLFLFLKVFEGITQQEASTASFAAAMLGSVSDATVVPTEAITVNMVSSQRRRALLATVSTLSTIVVKSWMPSDKVMVMLRQAMDDGSFLRSLKTRSGLQITGMYTTISDATINAPASSTHSSQAKMGKYL